MAGEVTTATVQQLVNPPPAFPVTPETAGGIGFTVASVIGALLYLRQRTSRVSLGVQQDRTEGAMLERALSRAQAAEADAREAWSRTNADATLIGQLRAENEYLKRELVEARAQITEVRRGFEGLGKKVDAAENSLSSAEKKIGESSTTPLGKT